MRRIWYKFSIPLLVLTYGTPIVYSLERSNDQFLRTTNRYTNEVGKENTKLRTLFGLNRHDKHVNFLFSSGPKS